MGKAFWREVLNQARGPEAVERDRLRAQLADIRRVASFGPGGAAEFATPVVDGASGECQLMVPLTVIEKILGRVER
jgi:hypothetical protein